MSENDVQRLALRLRIAKGMADIDSGDLHRFRVEYRTRERIHVRADRLAQTEDAVGVEPDRHGSDLEKGMPVAIEAAGLDIHHDGEEATKAIGHSRRGEASIHGSG